MEIVRLHLSHLQAFNNIPVHGFVIKHPKAGAILVDTGVGYPEELVKEWKAVNRHAADALAEHDLSPADVRIVINTHLHFDHCGQNAVFNHAPFYIQRTELARAREEESLTSEWFDFAGARFELVDGDAQIADGVRVVATPGHTSGHQSVVVDLEDGGALMIGDAAYTAKIYEEEAVDLWNGQAADRGAWARSLHRLKDMNPRAIHFCHDTKVIQA